MANSRPWSGCSKAVWSGSALFAYAILSEILVFEILGPLPYQTCPKIWNSLFYYQLMYLKYCCMYGKQCRPWSDAAFCGVWSGPTLFAKAYLSQYLWFYDIYHHLSKYSNTVIPLIPSTFIFLIWVLRPFQKYFTYIEPILHQRWMKTGESGEKPPDHP